MEEMLEEIIDAEEVSIEEPEFVEVVADDPEVANEIESEVVESIEEE